MGIEYTNDFTGDHFEIAAGSDIYIKSGNASGTGNARISGNGDALIEWTDLPPEVRDELWQFASRAEELMDSLRLRL